LGPFSICCVILIDKRKVRGISLGGKKKVKLFKEGGYGLEAIHGRNDPTEIPKGDPL